MKPLGRLSAIVLLALVRGTGAHSQSTPAPTLPADSPISFSLMMDHPTSMAEVLAASFTVDGKIQLVTRNLLVQVGEKVDAIPLIIDPVGGYILPGRSGGVPIQVDAFGEAQSLPLPPDFSGMQSIVTLAPHIQIQRIDSSKDSQVLAILVHGLAPSPYLLLLTDGIHHTKIADFTLSEDYPSAVHVSRDGGTVAVGYTDGTVRLWNVASKSELPSVHTLPAAPTVIGASFLDALCISPDGSHVFLAQADQRGQIIDRRGVAKSIVVQLPARSHTCSFDPNGQTIAVGAGSSELLERLNGQPVWSKTDASAPSSYVVFRDDGGELLFVDANGAHVRSAESGAAILYLTAHKATGNEWTAWSTSGRFDGSDEGMRHLRYVAADKSSPPLPVDALMRDYFTPGLAGNVLHGTALAAIAPRALTSSGQTVGLTLTGTPGKSADVAVNVVAVAKKGHSSVRLFRNGLLVKRWQSVDLTNSSGTVALTASVNLLPGTNHLLAYSYDDDGIKSADSALDCEGPKAVEPGILHLLVVGINQYQNNHSLDLTNAEADAQLIAQVFTAQRAQINREEQAMSSHPEMHYRREDRVKFAQAAGPVDLTIIPCPTCLAHLEKL